MNRVQSPKLSAASVLRNLVLVLGLALVITGAVAEEADAPIEKPTLTPEELENYQFDVVETPFQVLELTVGQLHLLDNQRRLGKDLLARKIGIISFKGHQTDLASLQQLIDRQFIKDRQIEEWQALGVLFGDVIANEFNMTWVRYEDELGASKALRWRSTDNFIFPVTLFSKRVGYGEKIDVQDIYDKLAEEVERFKQWELKPRFDR